MFLMSLRWSLNLFYAGFYKYAAPTVLFLCDFAALREAVFSINLGA